MDSNPRESARRPVVRQAGELMAGAHPGDRRLRVPPRPPPQRIPLPVPRRRRSVRNPALVFIYGFGGVIMAGTLLLTLPIASAEGRWTSLVDALFTATSAVCVTGLVVVDTGTYWSGVGQAIILVLIQVGGFGFMTSSTLLLLLVGQHPTLHERILLKEALGGGGLGSVRTLARRVIVFTLVLEALGAAILTGRFLLERPAPEALWFGAFHAVSAFNNAGFDLFGGYRSLTPYTHDAVLLLTLAGLFIVGGISYTVVADLGRTRRFVRMTLDTKLVLATTVLLVGAGVLALLFTERANPDTLGGMALGPRLLNAFFGAATPRTAGFNSIDTAKLTEPGWVVTMALMFVGGAAGSTAGGIKVQTFSLLFFAIVSAIQGHRDVEAFRRRVPTGNVLRGIAVALLSVALVFIVSFALSATENAPYMKLLFETVSAFGTVGLTAGVTPELSTPGRFLIIATMFAGRLGPLTLVLALAARERRALYQWPEEAVRIG